IAQERVNFNTEAFISKIGDYEKSMEAPEGLALTREYSSVYHRFLGIDLAGHSSIRGQMSGPVSFGFRVIDEGDKPIIYDDSVRVILFDFMQRKVNIQVQQLKEKNKRAFVWLDEPGLGWVFSGFTGYNDVQATEDYRNFFQGIEGIKALHLCAAINLPYLLGLGVELLSFDAYAIESMPMGYTEAIGNYLKEGKVIAWGIVPTDSDNLNKETPDTIAARLSGYWEKVNKGSGVDVKQIAEQAVITPARCCLKNIGKVGGAGETPSGAEEGSALGTIEESLVEKAFSYLPLVSSILKDKYHIK
ncbi:MAG: hypothetical protein U1D67_03780, partial [Dehalococcoidia bacterium]|nr:hypothetical protein [Dehalococcoidia bacterium]